MGRCVHHAHSLVGADQPLHPMAAMVSLTCQDAIHCGIATLTVTRPVESPSQTGREGDVGAFVATATVQFHE